MKLYNEFVCTFASLDNFLAITLLFVFTFFVQQTYGNLAGGLAMGFSFIMYILFLNYIHFKDNGVGVT